MTIKSISSLKLYNIQSKLFQSLKKESRESHSAEIHRNIDRNISGNQEIKKNECI